MAASGWHSLVGRWTGTDRIWFEPSSLANESPVDLVVRPTLGGRGLLFESRWSMGDEEHFTTLVLVAGATGTEGALIDTFHTGGAVMALAPVEARDGVSGSGAVAAAADSGTDPTADSGTDGLADGPARMDATLLAEARGTYEGDGERWGWHLAVQMTDHDHVVIQVVNVEPSGAAALAVRTTCTRAIDPHDEVAI
ncbi:MAG: DUF1579 family protein [Microthrixaceae bacterium]